MLLAFEGGRGLYLNGCIYGAESVSSRRAALITVGHSLFLHGISSSNNVELTVFSVFRKQPKKNARSALLPNEVVQWLSGFSSRFRTTRYHSASRCVLNPFLRYIVS